MPIFRLSNELIFPPPDLAEDNGLLAVGGDLCEKRLLLAYSMGIFPWYSKGDPVLWWSPDPRLVLLTKNLKISRSLRQTIRKGLFTITFDSSFEEVIKSCASQHLQKDGDTWITQDMIKAYISLHHSGYAHSVEAWVGGELAGGLYGVSLGSAFFGESMFTKRTDASKVAFATLLQQLIRWDFTLVDCQVATTHLKSFGAAEILRSDFLLLLGSALQLPTKKGKWKLEETGTALF
ncbi:MAG: leucyl/phenylalanyl-tRNA--protein transferase [Nitrospiraceae bacterium]|nr:MAG: leucyl/phenylalanyl-tRNA--protein transferase [Nitrospiraceae bacterium]